MFGFGNGFPMNDPFDDPFFLDPFAGMNHVMNSMMADPFFNPRRSARPVPVSADRLAQGPIIQEVDEEEQEGAAVDNQPIVEEPDDEQGTHARTPDRPAPQPHHERPYRRSRTDDYSMAGALSTGLFNRPSLFDTMFGSFGAGIPSGASTFSYSSSSFNSGGQGAVTYSKTTTTRMGPNGVAEVQETVRDGVAGTESHKVSRRLGAKERTVVKRRDRDGREEHQEQLYNLRDDELNHFDHQWNQQAEHALPNFGNRQLRQTQSDRYGMPQLDYQSYGVSRNAAYAQRTTPGNSNYRRTG